MRPHCDRLGESVLSHLVFLKCNRHFFYLDDYKVESLATSTAQLVQCPMSMKSHSIDSVLVIH